MIGVELPNDVQFNLIDIEYGSVGFEGPFRAQKVFCEKLKLNSISMMLGLNIPRASAMQQACGKYMTSLWNVF